MILLPQRHRQRGFTLLEVLVAFTIAAVALGLIYQVFARGATAAALGREYNTAVAIAESKLAALGVDEPLYAPQLAGVEDDRYAWDLEILDYEGLPGSVYTLPLELKEVRVRVQWNSGSGPRTLSLTTLKPVTAP